MTTSSKTDHPFTIPMPIEAGGTGEIVKADAFDALSPTSAQGDIIVRGASSNQRKAIGTVRQLLRVNSTGTDLEYLTERERAEDRDGHIFQTLDRAVLGATGAALTSGTVYAAATYLRKGEIITSLGILLQGGATTPTNWWYLLTDSARVVVARTADQLTNPTGASGELRVALTSPYTVPLSGQYYAMMMFAAAGTPAVSRIAGSSTNNGVAPILFGTSNTGMTTPPNVNDTMNALTAGTLNFWMSGK